MDTSTAVTSSIRHLSSYQPGGSGGGRMVGSQQDVGARMPQQNQRLGLPVVHHYHNNHNNTTNNHHHQHQHHLDDLQQHYSTPNSYLHNLSSTPTFIQRPRSLRQFDTLRPSIVTTTTSRGPAQGLPQRQSRQSTPTWYNTLPPNLQLPLNSSLPNSSSPLSFTQLAPSNNFLTATSTATSPVIQSLRMATNGMISSDELARMQELSNTWEPEAIVNLPAHFRCFFRANLL